ncbi:MAG: serine hydrolase domain-containing protein [Bryobacteraceae bacterium]
MTRRRLLLDLALAFRQSKLDEAVRLIEDRITSGKVSAAALSVRSGNAEFKRGFGKAGTSDAVFLLASITKPMTCTAVMLLADRKELSITDPVQKFIPEFQGGERNRVLIRHLLTHTSGLPDMLPENTDLRKRHAPLKDFVAASCRTPLLFSPGTRVRYQSMGTLLASEIVARITNRPFPAFLHEELFEPLGMQQTSLGLGGRAISDTMLCQVDEVTNWDWNSTYWRNLASPWGGAHSTVTDVSRFLHYFARPDSKVLKPETAALMIRNQNAGLNQPWGIGWMLNGSKFGKGCSQQTFGHSGSTGTLCWLDQENGLSFVLLTTKPAASSRRTLLQPVSNLVSESSHG